MSADLSSFAVSPSASELADFAGRAAVALVLGSAIGLERQWRQRRAGLRTNALVSLGSALFELLAVLLSAQHGADPTRIAAYVVSGIGFLGAGVILRDGVNVRGINTAATIWASAAVGTLVGAGYVVEGVVATVLILAVHTLLRPLGRRVDRLPATEDTEVETAYEFHAVCRSDDEAHIRALVVQALTGDEFVLRAVHSEDLDRGTDLVEVHADLARFGRNDVALERAVSRLSMEPSVTSVSWTVADDTTSPADLDS